MGASASVALAAPVQVADAAALELLEQTRANLAYLAGLDWAGAPGQVLLDGLRGVDQVARPLEAVRAKVTAAAQSDSSWALDGSRSLPVWLERHTGASRVASRRQLRTAQCLTQDLPATVEALAQGRIGVDHSIVLAREVTRTQRMRELLRDDDNGEAFLLTHAAELDAATFATVAKSWAVMADPDAADRAWREAGDKEELFISPTMGGYYVQGQIDEANGRLIEQALAAVMGRRAEGDERTPAQRRAAAFVSIMAESLSSGRTQPSARIPRQLSIHVPYDTLQGLIAACPPARPRDPNSHPSGTPQTSDSGEHRAGREGAAFGGTAAGNGTTAPNHGSAGNGAASPNGAAARNGAAPGNGTAAGNGAAAGNGEAGNGRLADGDAHGSDRLGDGSAGEQRVMSDGEWAEAWEPGFDGDHVISTRLDHRKLRGIAPATFSDGTPIPPALLARLACGSQLSRIVFGPHSTVLDVGRAQRIFPANQTKAVIARDRHCQYPGCHEPPEFGEIHHSLWWAKHHGPTAVSHGILLCWTHHDHVHRREITIERRDGQWHFTSRHGTPILPPTHARDTDEI